MDNDRRHFSYLAHYNRTANEALIGHLGTLGKGEISAPRGSYFGSIQGILDHIIMCDINWLRRFRELYPKDEPLNRPRLSPAGHVWVMSYPVKSATCNAHHFSTSSGRWKSAANA